jgi:hypothetical protein
MMRILSCISRVFVCVQALNECRRLIADDADLNDLRDATLARYLRHNSWNVEPAIQQLKEYLVSRYIRACDAAARLVCCATDCGIARVRAPRVMRSSRRLISSSPAMAQGQQDRPYSR